MTQRQRLPLHEEHICGNDRLPGPSLLRVVAVLPEQHPVGGELLAW
jgi:hypothetical protein